MNLLGKIAVQNLGFEKREIVWYIESNVVLKSLFDYFGTDYMKVEKMDLNTDALKLLTDFSFDD